MWEEYMRMVEDLEKRVRATPQDAELQFELAKAYYLGERNDEALEQFTKIASTVDPHRRASVTFYLGRIYIKQGNRKLAINELDKALDDVVSDEIRKDIGRHLIECLEQEGRHHEATRLRDRLGS